LIKSITNIVLDLAMKTITFNLLTKDDDGRDVYITGTFNDWNPHDEQYKMNRLKNGRYKLKIKLTDKFTFPAEYKYTKGGWENEEVTIKGHKSKNRIIKKVRRSVTDRVPRFLFHGNLADFRYRPIIEKFDKFPFPYLGVVRTVRVVLPYNYNLDQHKHYKVLYLQDGQNLWDNSAPFGSWSLDQKLTQMAISGKTDLIIVAIDHGGVDRIREYTPISGTRVGRGDGQKYLSDVAKSVKPFIDNRYRTLRGREYTGLGGSSMGGLITLYGGIFFPEVFGKLMIFSPSLWLIRDAQKEIPRFYTPFPTQVYLYTGGKESASMVPAMKKLKNALENQHFFDKLVEVKLSIDPSGKHNEEKWGKELTAALIWLFYRN
jgi:predicted alpha/beta superfamily hydrolase